MEAFYLTLGNALTMLKSLVKFNWEIDYQGLVKSIHFETPKALFMQQKVTLQKKSRHF